MRSNLNDIVLRSLRQGVEKIDPLVYRIADHDSGFVEVRACQDVVNARAKALQSILAPDLRSKILNFKIGLKNAIGPCSKWNF